MEMIKVILDSNIFFRKIRPMANSKRALTAIDIDSFCQLLKENRVLLQFSWTNFTEYLMGINRDYFDEYIKEAQLYSKVTSNGSLIEAPTEHIQRECAMLLQVEPRLCAQSSIEKIELVSFVMARFANLTGNDFDEVKPILEPLQESFRNYKKERVESSRRLLKKYQAYSNKEKTRFRHNWQEVFIAMMQQLNIPDGITGRGHLAVFNDVFSLRYRFAAFWGSCHRIEFRGRHRKGSEYGDIEQACFLSSSEYWVTGDNEAKGNFAEAENLDLLRRNEVTPRILSWNEFLDKLIKKELREGIAPRKTTTVRYVRRPDGGIELQPV